MGAYTLIISLLLFVIISLFHCNYLIPSRKKLAIDPKTF